MWWSIVTITTVRYVDMVPSTAIGQALAGFVSFLGICAIALPVGILSSGYVEEIAKASRGATCPHCNKELEARRTAE